jgi:hypothetical protein
VEPAPPGSVPAPAEPGPAASACHARTLRVWSSRGITSRILSRAI